MKTHVQRTCAVVSVNNGLYNSVGLVNNHSDVIRDYCDGTLSLYVTGMWSAGSRQTVLDRMRVHWATRNDDGMMSHDF